jgi:flagellar hook-associated protein 1 FlgK
MSTFHGLEMAKQALFAQQSALYTTGHNISNANTDGYSRQRVNFETMNPFPSASRNRQQIPGQMGTGVQIGTVERVRSSFLDYQFRVENSKSGYWDTKAATLSRMEELINEPSEVGLAETMDQFWQSLQDLAVSPDNPGARSVVVERGHAVAETFNYLSKSLYTMRSDVQSQTDITVKDANALLRQINGMNKQVKQLESHDYIPNDLYDERDRLIDELSSMINIKVTYEKSDEGAPAIAEGLVKIVVVDSSGKSMGVSLVNPTTGKVNEISIEYGNNDTAAVTSLAADGVSIIDANGSLTGLIESYGYETNGRVLGAYTDMLKDLNQMAGTFGEAFNKVHNVGYDLNGNQGIDFFKFSDLDAADSIMVNPELLGNAEKLAASTIANNIGNGENAKHLTDVFDKKLDGLGTNTSVIDFYQSMIGELGVRSQEANRMTKNTSVLCSQVDNKRMSVSAVSLDEEMANMIKFQHAYNAAARSMTVVDEMIDRIINNMGLVGR